MRLTPKIVAQGSWRNYIPTANGTAFVELAPGTFAEIPKLTPHETHWGNERVSEFDRLPWPTSIISFGRSVRAAGLVERGARNVGQGKSPNRGGFDVTGD